jgi:hypothetical protein
MNASTARYGRVPDLSSSTVLQAKSDGAVNSREGFLLQTFPADGRGSTPGEDDSAELARARTPWATQAHGWAQASQCMEKPTSTCDLTRDRTTPCSSWMDRKLAGTKHEYLYLKLLEVLGA